MTKRPLLGEILVDRKIVSQEIIDEALRLQVGGNRRLGHLLVKMKTITDDQLAEVLADQLDIPIVDVATEHSPEVKSVIPRYLCKQYGVLPLRLKANNVLKVAMANPSDQDAITDLEHYTGRVIEPSLARHSDIDREIPRKVPLGAKDIFSPQANVLITRTVATLALACAIGIGIYTFDYIKQVHEGTTSIAGDLILYQNHDLTLAVDKNGKYSLQGHGAYADGLYKAEFTSLQYLEQFVDKRRDDFSDKQHLWLQWALDRARQVQGKNLIAQN